MDVKFGGVIEQAFYFAFVSAFLWGFVPKKWYLTAKFQWREFGAITGLVWIGVAITALLYNYSHFDFDAAAWQIMTSIMPSLGYLISRVIVGIRETFGPKKWKHYYYIFYSQIYDLREMIMIKMAERRSYQTLGTLTLTQPKDN